MKYPTIFAIIFIAFNVATTRASGQNVYRCGNSYSQTPCVDGVLIDAQDSRTKAQKADSDALIRKEVATAKAMEQTRLQAQAQQEADLKKSTKRVPAEVRAQPAEPHLLRMRRISTKPRPHASAAR